jgi:hypothetical protein
MNLGSLRKQEHSSFRSHPALRFPKVTWMTSGSSCHSEKSGFPKSPGTLGTRSNMKSWFPGHRSHPELYLTGLTRNPLLRNHRDESEFRIHSEGCGFPMSFVIRFRGYIQMTGLTLRTPGTQRRAELWVAVVTRSSDMPE